MLRSIASCWTASIWKRCPPWLASGTRRDPRGRRELIEEEKTPLSLMEKDRVIEEVLDEVFGLGPSSRCCAIPPSRTSW